MFEAQGLFVIFNTILVYELVLFSTRMRVERDELKKNVGLFSLEKCFIVVGKFVDKNMGCQVPICDNQKQFLLFGIGKNWAWHGRFKNILSCQLVQFSIMIKNN